MRTFEGCSWVVGYHFAHDCFHGRQLCFMPDDFLHLFASFCISCTYVYIVDTANALS